MKTKIIQYLDRVFAQAPCTQKAVEMKEAILADVLEKYEDLIASGRSEEEAYNLAVGSIGDLSKLIADLRNGENVAMSNAKENNYSFQNQVDPAEVAKYKQRSGLLRSIAVAMYICCVIWPILLGDVAGPVMMFIFIGVATALMIYSASTNPYKNVRIEGCVKEASNSESSKGNPAFTAINSALWALTVLVYVVVSFATSAWYITWVIFLISVAISNIVRALFDLVGGGK